MNEVYRTKFSYMGPMFSCILPWVRVIKHAASSVLKMQLKTGSPCSERAVVFSAFIRGQ